MFATLWVAMMYSSGLPVLYPIAFLSFFLAYWIQKWLLVKSYRKTSAFNQNLAFDTIPLMKMAIFLHLFTSVFMLTSREILTIDHKLIDKFNSYAGNSEINKLAEENEWVARFLQPIGLAYIIFILFIIFGYIFKNTFLVILGKLYVGLKYMCFCCFGKG